MPPEKMSWGLNENDFQSRPDHSFEQVPAPGCAIALSKNDMCVDLRFAFAQCDVAREGKDLYLLTNWNLFVIFFLDFKEPEFYFGKCSDPGELCRR